MTSSTATDRSPRPAASSRGTTPAPPPPQPSRRRASSLGDGCKDEYMFLKSVKGNKNFKWASEKARWAAEGTKKMGERPLRPWLGPLCLPMLLVIQPLTDYNFRTILVLCILSFLVWFQYKNTGRSTKKAWLRGQERHCEKCDKQLLQQLTVANKAEIRWGVRSLRKIPLRLLSRYWGTIANNTVLPVWINVIVLWVYSTLFSCKVHEADRESLSQYQSLGDFFTRRLKPGMRPVCPNSPVVSPADGKITWQGRYTGGFLQQVKGVHYSLNYFLGLENSEGSHGRIHASTEDYQRLLVNSTGDTSLYQCVIYLAPGDYHRFHSPTDWTITKRRHFPGDLMSVKPGMVSSFPGLFHVNERVSWMGHWQHGFFSMTAVGATNVGSIHADFEPDLKTNQAVTLKRECTMTSACSRRNFHFNEKRFDGAGVAKTKGEDFGHFNFGSTIVLLFEAPKGFKFGGAAAAGSKVQVGQRMVAAAAAEL